MSQLVREGSPSPGLRAKLSYESNSSPTNSQVRILQAYMIKLFQDAITSFRDRLAWIYRTYFSADEQVGLNLSLRPDPYWHQSAVPLGLISVSMVGAALTLIYLFSVR